MRSSGGDRGEKRPQIKHLKYTPTGELPANALVIEDSLNGVRSGKAVPCVPVRLRSPVISPRRSRLLLVEQERLDALRHIIKRAVQARLSSPPGGSGSKGGVEGKPGASAARREPSLQALLRELAAFNKGLCVITTRIPVADIAHHEGSSALRRDLEQLSSDAGAKLIRALGVKGDEAELRSASDEFRGHCLALTLLGSYLTDAYNGDIRRRKEVSPHLGHDVRQGSMPER